MDHDVIKKVRDLLRLQRRAATPGEAQAAAFALGKLLTKHQLDIASIETDVDRERAALDDAPLALFGRLCRWRVALARSICDHMHVACWLLSKWVKGSRSGRTMSILLCGRPSDTSAVHSMFTWLVTEAERLCAEQGYLRKERNDWLLGFASGVGEQLRKAKEQATQEYTSNDRATDCVAMVLASRYDEARSLMRATIGHNKEHRMRPVMVYMDAYSSGRENGMKIHLGKSLPQSPKQLGNGG